MRKYYIILYLILVVSIENFASPISRAERLFSTGKEKLKLRAVRILSRKENSESDRFLLANVKDPNPVVRKAIIEEFTFRHSDVAKKVLTEVATGKEPTDIVLIALMGLLKQWPDKGEEVVLRLLSSTNQLIRLKAIEIVGLRRIENSIDRLLELFKSSDVKTVAAAVRSAGRIGDNRIIVPLIEVLSHQDPNVKYNAIIMLMRMDVYKAAEEIKRLFEDPSPKVRIAAIRFIGHFASLLDFDLIVEQLERDKNETVKKWCIRVLSRGYRYDERTPEVIKKYLNSDSEELAKTAETALIKMGVISKK